MKKLAHLLLGFLLSLGSYAQTSNQVKDFATLAKVWGFLKYYHSSPALGKPDWDSALLKMIPQLEAISSKEQYDELLEKWYHSLPVAKVSATAVDWNQDTIKRTFTEKNIQQFHISSWMKKEFTRLYHHHLPAVSRYVTRYYNNHHFDHIIHTEDAHDKPTFPDRNMRLLSLFRYWNTIEYFYPHRGNIKAWDAVLLKYIPVFLGAENVAQYHYAIRQLAHELPDSHSFLQMPGDTYLFYPFRIDYIEGKYLIGQCDEIIAKKWDYQKGDEVVAINGISVKEREQQLLKITTGTNDLSLHRNIAKALFNLGDSIVQVRFKRHDSIITRTVEMHTWEVYRSMPKSKAAPLWEEIEKDLWVVRFCRITNKDTLPQLFRDIHHAKAVIWDMRDYPNYNVTTALGDYIFPAKTILSDDCNASDYHPGTFVTFQQDFTPAHKQDSLYTGKMIVLVDENTQSLSESIAAMLRLRPNTITMGRQTAGTTGNITWLTLPGDIAISYTGVGVEGLHKTFQQGKGVKIDVPVELTPSLTRKSKDYILEQAIKYSGKN